MFGLFNSFKRPIADKELQASHFSHPKYRPDIDGLRAVAVLAVVMFHAFPNWLKGGFIGVDVFFVISGFLISTIIFENLDTGTFSFAEFYARRIRRIFPALILVLAACFVFGWFALLADEYKQLSEHIAAGAAFVANLVLWQEAGYFDNSAETKPLLHLWSLGIEEQFYIVWPLLLWFGWKRNFNLLSLTILIAISSLGLNIKGIRSDAVATFYSPQTRFWELLAGSLLAWVTLYQRDCFRSLLLKLDHWLSSVIYRQPPKNDGKTLANGLAFLGLLLLAYGFWRINKTSNFPGGWALIPVLGTIFLIGAGQRVWINRTFLSNKIAVWFGMISFPVYLWHWPLLSFARIVEGETPSLYVRIVAVVLSVVFAWLTYRFVERPFRFGGNRKLKVLTLVVLMTSLGCTGYVTYRQGGLVFRSFHQKYLSYVSSIKVTERSAECFEIPYAYKKPEQWFCSLGDKLKPIKYFAYGDSHALSAVPYLEKYAVEHNVNIQLTGTSGCPSLLGIQSMRGAEGIEKYNCRDLNERIFNYVKDNGIKNVILINRWTYYTGSKSRSTELNPISRNPESPVSHESSKQDLLWALNNTVKRYKDIGVNVLFVEDNPQQLHEPKDILRKGAARDDLYNKYSVSYAEHLDNQSLVNSAIRASGGSTVSFDDILCDGQICPLVSNSKFMYSDDDHLSVDGAMMLYPKFEAWLLKVGL